MVDKSKMVQVIKQTPLRIVTSEKGSLMLIPKNQQGTLTTTKQQIIKTTKN
jgi:ethanolamine utilization protein EutQ (cupin superfamily)